MKSLWIAAIAVLLAVPMVACAQEGADNPASPPQPTEQSAQAEPSQAQPAQQNPAAPQPTPQYAAGEYYTRIEPAQPTDHPGKIEVVEVFSYACPSCNAFEPFIEEWLANAPKDVAFVRVPAIFGQTYQAYARAFYTAQALGVLADTHAALFDAVHQQNRRFSSQEDLAAFYAEHGVNPETYLSTAQSFAVETQLNRAQVLAPRYGVTGVPTMIVNGKYRVQAGAPIGSYGELLEVVKYLVQKERQAASATAAAPAPDA